MDLFPPYGNQPHQPLPLQPKLPFEPPSPFNSTPPTSFSNSKHHQFAPVNFTISGNNKPASSNQLHEPQTQHNPTYPSHPNPNFPSPLHRSTACRLPRRARQRSARRWRCPWSTFWSCRPCGAPGGRSSRGNPVAMVNGWTDGVSGLKNLVLQYDFLNMFIQYHPCRSTRV